MQIHAKIGDALKGERIAVSARQIQTPYVTEGSGRHRVQRTKLRDNAFCIIELPTKAVENAMRKRE